MNNPIFTFFKELVLRIKAKSPAFFNTLKWISAFIIAFATVLLTTLPTETLEHVLSFYVFTVSVKMFLSYIIAFFSAVFGTSQTTAKYPSSDVDQKLGR